MAAKVEMVVWLLARLVPPASIPHEGSKEATQGRWQALEERQHELISYGAGGRGYAGFIRRGKDGQRSLPRARVGRSHDGPSRLAIDVVGATGDWQGHQCK